MPRKTRIYGESGYMHIISRGVAKQIIFEDEQDHKVFISLMQMYSIETGVTVIAYCLMDNHYHMLIQTKGDSVSKFIHHLGTKYSIYYNAKYDRTGHLFQDRFKSENVEDESYFMTVFRYIIRNPETAGICKTEEYKWHSLYHPESINKFVDLRVPIGIAGGVNKLRKFVLTDNNDECMDYKNVISDEDALKIIHDKLGLKSGTEISKMPKQQRDSAVITLTRNGLTIRQISRLTGVARSTIARILK